MKAEVSRQDLVSYKHSGGTHCNCNITWLP